MKLLIHTSKRNAEAVIDGKAYSIPPNKVFKVLPQYGMDHNNNGPQEYAIPEDIVAQKLVEHCWHYGLIEIPIKETETDLGVNIAFDAKAALELSHEALIRAEEQMLMNYVKISQDRMSQQLPAMPPPPRVQQIIEERGIDLRKEFNLSPIGYGQVAQAADRQAEIEEIRRENADLKRQFAEFMANQPTKRKEKEPAI